MHLLYFHLFQFISYFYLFLISTYFSSKNHPCPDNIVGCFIDQDQTAGFAVSTVGIVEDGARGFD